MKVEIISQNIDEYTLNTIAGISRKTSRAHLFRDTIEWGHDSIQEFIFFIFYIEDISRVTLAQLTRHRMACYNVTSGRYTDPTSVRLPNHIAKLTGTITYTDGDTVEWEATYGDFIVNAHNKSREDVRYGFPQATTVSLYMGINGRSLRNFLKLRMDKHAQWEIRELANQMYELVHERIPVLGGDLK